MLEYQVEHIQSELSACQRKRARCEPSATDYSACIGETRLQFRLHRDSERDRSENHHRGNDNSRTGTELPVQYNVRRGKFVGSDKSLVTVPTAFSDRFGLDE